MFISKYQIVGVMLYNLVTGCVQTPILVSTVATRSCPFQKHLKYFSEGPFSENSGVFKDQKYMYIIYIRFERSMRDVAIS